MMKEYMKNINKKTTGKTGVITTIRKAKRMASS